MPNSSPGSFTHLKFSRCSPGTCCLFCYLILPTLVSFQHPPPKGSPAKRKESHPQTPGMFSITVFIAFLQWEMASFPPYTMHSMWDIDLCLPKTYLCLSQTPRHHFLLYCLFLSLLARLPPSNPPRLRTYSRQIWHGGSSPHVTLWETQLCLHIGDHCSGCKEALPIQRGHKVITILFQILFQSGWPSSLQLVMDLLSFLRLTCPVPDCFCLLSLF